MKNKKELNDFLAEEMNASDCFVAELEASPGYEEALQEVRAEIEEERLAGDYAVREAKARAEMEEAIAAAEASAAMRTVKKLSNLTQREIAQRMGVSQPTVAGAQQGYITFATLSRYCKACGFELVLGFRPLTNAVTPRHEVITNC